MTPSKANESANQALSTLLRELVLKGVISFTIDRSGNNYDHLAVRSGPAISKADAAKLDKALSFVETQYTYASQPAYEFTEISVSAKGGRGSESPTDGFMLLSPKMDSAAQAFAIKDWEYQGLFFEEITDRSDIFDGRVYLNEIYLRYWLETELTQEGHALMRDFWTEQGVLTEVSGDFSEGPVPVASSDDSITWKSMTNQAAVLTTDNLSFFWSSGWSEMLTQFVAALGLLHPDSNGEFRKIAESILPKESVKALSQIKANAKFTYQAPLPTYPAWVRGVHFTEADITAALRLLELWDAGQVVEDWEEATEDDEDNVRAAAWARGFINGFVTLSKSQLKHISRQLSLIEAAL